MTAPASQAESAVVLIGPMGAGKTSIGTRLARNLGWSFTDTDSLVVREHGPVEAIFAERGEPAFRALERIAVRRALAVGGVVALGGGAVLDAETRADLRDVLVVHVTVDPLVVAPRLARGRRPLLTGGGIARWTEIAEERAPLYRDLADLTVDTSRLPISRLAHDLAERVRERTGTAS